jgi:hypothetical protein
MLFLLQQQDQTVSFRRQAADHGEYHHSFKRAFSSWGCLLVHVYWMTLPMSPPAVLALDTLGIRLLPTWFIKSSGGIRMRLGSRLLSATCGLQHV